MATVLAEREDIIQKLLELGEFTTEELQIRGDLRIRGLRPMPLGYLNHPGFRENVGSTIKRLLQH